MVKQNRPTEEAYAELQYAYDFYNKELFDGQLTSCLLTYQRSKRTFGYFSKDRFGHRDARKTHELALNPEYFAVVPLIEVLQTLDDLVKQGKIRHAGLSNETAWGVMQYLRIARENNLPVMASIQNEYGLLRRIFEPDLAEVALRENIGLLAWSPLGGGMISGKYLDRARPPGSRWSLDTRPLHRDTPPANEAVRAYMSIAHKHDLDLCQMALAFVNRQPFVTANIIGATTMDQLRNNIGSIDIKLSDDVLADIAAVRRRYPIPY